MKKSLIYFNSLVTGEYKLTQCCHYTKQQAIKRETKTHRYHHFHSNLFIQKQTKKWNKHDNSRARRNVDPQAILVFDLCSSAEICNSIVT